MDRVEEKALKAYPKMSRITEPHGVIPADNVSHLVGDANTERREGYVMGYRQAEKELALTWEDIKLLHNISSEVWSVYFDDCIINDKEFCDEEYYQEVLKRFNERKNKQTNHEEDNV